MSGIISTSNSKSGTIGRSLDTAKAWVRWNSSGTILDDYNISSIAGYQYARWKINFARPMAGTNYVIAGTSAGDKVIVPSTAGGTRLTTSVDIYTMDMSNSTAVQEEGMIVIFEG